MLRGGDLSRRRKSDKRLLREAASLNRDRIGAMDLIGRAAILALGDSDDAVRSMAIGIAVGETQIWS